MVKNRAKEKIVLVAVLKEKRDLDILLTENWYRMPVQFSPIRRPDYLAFYQPAVFGRQGKRIQYYARVLSYQTSKRKDLLSEEPGHVRACDDYFRVQVGKVKKLARPVKNIIPRRVSFGFITLNHLLKSKNILQLFGVAPTEKIMGNGLKKAGIKAISQHYVLAGKKPRSRTHGMIVGRRFCLDFAVFCKQGKIAIECDNKRAHSSPCQRKKDKRKNVFLRRYGWRVIRFPEDKIVFDLQGCIARVQKAVQKLGGFSYSSH